LRWAFGVIASRLVLLVLVGLVSLIAALAASSPIALVAIATCVATVAVTLASSMLRSARGAGSGEAVAGARPRAVGAFTFGSPTASEAPAARPVASVSFKLPRDEIEGLKMLAQTRRISLTQALRQAIATERFIADHPTGSKLLIQYPNGEVHEVRFHWSEES
jgi:hypothetical protein